MLSEKLAKLQKHLRLSGHDALLLGNFGCHAWDDLLYWLLLTKPEWTFFYLPARGRPSLFSIPFEVRQQQRQFPELKIFPFDRPLEKLLTNLLPTKLTRARVAFRPSCLPYSVFEKLKKIRLKLAALTHEEELVAIKSTAEISRLKRAAGLTDELFSRLVRHWRDFATEANAAKWLLTNMAGLGVEPSFAPIIASGAAAADPHHATSAKKLRRGFCVIDMGVRYEGYCSDMTRTIFIGQPTTAERQLYKKILTAQTATVAKVKAGVTTVELDKFCRSHLGAKLNREFIHGLGHGVGTQVHEWPRVGGGRPITLASGMVITIEPGVYQAGRYGIRIEDDLLVKKNTAEILTASPKRLIVV